MLLELYSKAYLNKIYYLLSLLFYQRSNHRWITY